MRRMHKKHDRRQPSTFTRFQSRMLRGVYTALRWISHCFYDPHCWRIGRLVLAISLMGVCLSSLADGTDILQGTDASLWATLNGTGKKYIYAAEGILGLAAYMKTKNLVVLSGIVVVSIFFNIILSVAGESA